jgi:hypothetical protein
MTPEGRVKAKLKKQLVAYGYYQEWHVPVGYGKQGVDCLVCAHGRFIAIECKREGIETPTPRQAAVMREMRKAGALTYLVTMQDGELKWIGLKE